MSATQDAERRDDPVHILIVVTAAVVTARLISLQWLHPLNWDELEFFRATAWIAQGRVPFRDFWEHHTPLVWLLFAPFTYLTDSPGVDAVIALRWVQVPVWVVTFVLTNLWMRNAGIARFARWAAIALALSSALFMLPAIEYRVDSVAALLFMAGLVLAQRGWMFSAGALFCLVGLANVRFGPLLVVTVLLLRVVTPQRGEWAGNRRANRLFAGGIVALLLSSAWFAATDSLLPMYQQVWVENRYEKFMAPVEGAFVHRLLVPFGIRILGENRSFDVATIDVGGGALLVLGVLGLVGAFRRWRSPDYLVMIAILQTTNLLFISSMKYVYNYHFLLVVILMLPLGASIIQRWVSSRPSSRRWLMALVVLAGLVNAFGSIFRGKELDRAYQDRVMREAHARTSPEDKVWSGIPWVLRREPAYRFWFLPQLARTMVTMKFAPRYSLEEMAANPPAVIVFDHNALVWVATVQRELVPYLVRHYIPVWRNLWIPGMNGRLAPRAAPVVWITPRDGTYSVYFSASLASHPWFHDPLGVASYKRDDARRFTFQLSAPAVDPAIAWWVDGKPAQMTREMRLRKGQRVAAATRGERPVALFLIPTGDRLLFRQPPPTVSLEGEALRVTHIPTIGAHLQP